jgi:hypothetical protein
MWKFCKQILSNQCLSFSMFYLKIGYLFLFFKHLILCYMCAWLSSYVNSRLFNCCVWHIYREFMQSAQLNPSHFCPDFLQTTKNVMHHKGHLALLSLTKGRKKRISTGCGALDSRKRRTKSIMVSDSFSRTYLIRVSLTKGRKKHISTLAEHAKWETQD